MLLSFLLPRISDYQIRMCEGTVTKTIAPFVNKVCDRILVTPDVDPPILTGKDAIIYKKFLRRYIDSNIDIVTSIKLTSETTPEMIMDAKFFNVTVVKICPNSVPNNFFSEPKSFSSIFKAIENYDLVLSIPNEIPGVNYWLAEQAFMLFIDHLVKNYKFRIVIEHVNSKAIVETITNLYNCGFTNIAGTITAQHLYSTPNKINYRFHSHNSYIAISKLDQQVLKEAVINNLGCFFFGSNSDPRSGIFSIPTALECLAEIFEEEKRLNFLADFTSKNGNKFYRFEKINEDALVFKNLNWIAPKEYDGIKIFKSGEVVKWTIEK